MKIIYHDRNRLILKTRLRGRTLLFCFGSATMLAMVFTTISMVVGVGNKRLSCSRTAFQAEALFLQQGKSSSPISKPSAICVVRESKYVGLVQSPSRTFEQVQKAQAQSVGSGMTSVSISFELPTHAMNDRSTTHISNPTRDNILLFMTASGPAIGFNSQHAMRVNGSKGSLQELQTVANEFNEFIQSDRPQLRIQNDGCPSGSSPTVCCEA